MTSASRVVVLGSGARESALARAIARSPSVAEVVVAPGNAGTAETRPGSAPIRRGTLPAGLSPASALEIARRERADLVVVGPEAPLCAGVVDALEAAGVPAFGPRRDAAALEGSKAFLKRFAARHGIPTAPFAVVSSFAEAEAEIRRRGAPIVVKADGLCAGKGVVVAATVDEALAAARRMLVDRVFGEAGATVILEDVIPGHEASVHAISDGERLLVLPPARDHKRLGDGDQGPNTGGMGAFAPVDLAPDLIARVERTLLAPTIEGMRAEGRPFRGALFAGLMITPGGEPFLLEHNVRFGDPECEVLMALLEGDVAALLLSAARGALDAGAVRVAEGRHALAVILAAAGYPASPRAGDVIDGLDRAAAVPSVLVHHAGTEAREGATVTAGGRVLAVTATGGSLAEARARAYGATGHVHFDGMIYRRDIGLDGGPESPPNPPGKRVKEATVAYSVLIVMGSDSDFDQTAPAWKVLESLGVGFEVSVASAHRSPDRVVAMARGAREKGFGVILAAAGGAAHLAGVLAAHTTLPVVSVPIAIGTLGGVDALLSAVQMPGGVPIASVGIGGARNAGFFAAAILAATDRDLAVRLEAFRDTQAKNVADADARVKAKLAG